MATPAAKPIRVKVMYDFRNGNFHTVPRKPRLKIKAYVEFYTDIKGGKVDVLLDPARAFRPAEYKTGQKKLIHVTKRFGKGMIWCGGTYPSPPGTGTAPITINPQSREYGSHIDDGSTP